MIATTRTQPGGPVTSALTLVAGWCLPPAVCL